MFATEQNQQHTKLKPYFFPLLLSTTNAAFFSQQVGLKFEGKHKGNDDVKAELSGERRKNFSLGSCCSLLTMTKTENQLKFHPAADFHSKNIYLVYGE